MPGLLEAHGMSAFSKMGKASISARIARMSCWGSALPLSSATTPVFPTIS